MIFLLHVEWPEMPPYAIYYYYYYCYYAAFNAPCVGHKDDESWASGVESNYTKKR